jgi:glyoxalase family protein
MQLQALHHITMITRDATANVAFHADLLGLRMVKKTVNFDDPMSYHLYFGDEQGSPGSILTWFEIPHVAPGRPGAGMLHRIDLAVPSVEALGFWEERLVAAAVPARRDGDALDLADPDGLALRLTVAEIDPPQRAWHPEIPEEHAITGILGARAYALEPDGPHPWLGELFGFSPDGPGAYRVDGGGRTFAFALDPAPIEPGRPGSGTVHHIAWASRDEDHLAWLERLQAIGAPVSPVMDRDYFRSIYVRTPLGVLFEIATLSPGFAVDEDADRLGEDLRLPRMHAHLRDVLEQRLTPLANPRRAVTG